MISIINRTAILLLLALSTQGCVLRFSNSDRRIDANYRRIFVPSAVDSSSRGGQASRISRQLRQALALDTRFVLVPLNEARLAVDVQILDSKKVTTATADCDRKPTNNRVASGAFSCDDAMLNINQATVSSEKENLVMEIQVRVIDLNSGHIVSKNTFKNISSEYPVVSASDTVNANLSRTPQLHALRYVENMDGAVDSIGSSVASSVLSALLSLSPQDFEGPTLSKSPEKSKLGDASFLN